MISQHTVPSAPPHSDSPLHTAGIIRSTACQPHTVLETVAGSTSFTDERQLGMSGPRDVATWMMERG
ncbi:hypothetical protein IRJ41_016580 [Triplophysa rosa]|uniref:Uncharacterized protein n=1 Tax=Triplophysa rosa TaxID=992332 RepID=A0A9W7WZQ5_TRIRA|nr:hypothetical protein IRJ41_016580 [Triplophysa rosa]